MRFLSAFLLLLGLQLCAPQAQVPKRDSKTAGASAASSKTSAARRTIICIDPGHPSEVASGRNIQNGTNETRVAWEVALRLKTILEESGYEVCMTKTAEDELVRNRDRALVANRAGAALMVRLHCDASMERGFTVYYPDRAGQTKDGATGPPPRVIDESRRAAQAVRTGMAEGLAGVLKDNGVRTDYQTKVGREQGGALTGSIFSHVPVITIEMVVLSDRDDAEFIKAEAGQQRMAGAIADGISRFIGPFQAVSPRKD